MSIMITPLCHRGIRPQRNAERSVLARRTCSTIIGGAPLPLDSPNQEEAAKLLMAVRSLALKELGSSCTISPPEHDVSKVPHPMQPAPQLTSSPTATRRSRIVSVCSMDEDEDLAKTIMIPIESTTFEEAACVTPITPDLVQFPSGTSKLPESLFLHSLSSPIPATKLDLLPRKGKTVPYTPQQGKKLVGNVLSSGTQVRSVLRKKFSWKSFPELETYLIDHREQYLSFSSSLNYTKAQKLYNNQLTQGLLDLAAQQGYVFEGFTFAAIRDRIRCFYKSYVQAIKKKKKKSNSTKRGSGGKQQKQAAVVVVV